MRDIQELKEYVEIYYHGNYTQSEAVKILLEKGYSEADIKLEIQNVYPVITESCITKSASFIITSLLIGVLSLTPLIGLFIDLNIFYGLFSIILLIAFYGFLKLNYISIVFWLCFFVLLELSFLFLFFAKASEWRINSTYSYGVILSLIVFTSMILRGVYDVYSNNEKIRAQYKF